MASANADAKTCWKKAYGRGIGKLKTICPADKEKDDLLCYPKCRDGYSGVGPVCWQTCPSDFSDALTFCNKPSSYNRGVGSMWECDNCERCGLLWYPKCRENFHSEACLECSPDCPSGMTDMVTSCVKDSYSRTVGTLPSTCTPGKESDGGLCYPTCEHGADGVGPVCWGHCPAGTTMCDGALCLTPD